MKTNALIRFLSVTLLVTAPFIYLATIWQQLPDKVPTHFGMDGRPDSFSTKVGALVPIFMVMLVALGVYFLIKNIDKIDPKRSQNSSKETFDKMAMLILVFMSGLALYIVHSMLTAQTGGFLFVILGLFFTGLGNFMHSIQPNYFVGLRLPWTLENEDNWRKTHQLAGKMWFFGGLLIAIAALLLPESATLILMLVSILVMCLIPSIYSYRLYKTSI